MRGGESRRGEHRQSVGEYTQHGGAQQYLWILRDKWMDRGGVQVR